MRPLSARNPRVQRLTRLVRQREERATQRAFVVEGPTLLAYAMSAGVELREVYVDEAALLRTAVADVVAAIPGSIDPWLLPPGILDRIGDAATSQGIVTVVEQPEFSWPTPSEAPFVLVLDEVADPGNAGTLVRAAAAAGAGAVVMLGGVDPTNPKVVRASAGSVLTTPVLAVGPGPTGVERLRADGYRVLATSVRGGDPYDRADLVEPVAIVVGNEARGVTPEVAAAADATITIPMAGPTESLNVAMAGTVLCFEVLRRRQG